MATMQSLKELQRRASPGARPQPLALFQGALWVGSWETNALYAIDPKSWKTIETVPAPGRPYGIAPLNGALRVVVSDGGEADDRYLYRFTPGKGFDESSKTACPDFTGSHLASKDGKLYLGQMHNRRILVLDADDAIAREIQLPTRTGGFGFGSNDDFYLIAADEEFERLELATLDLQQPNRITVMAPIEFGARGLTYDGGTWFTSDREASQIVSFALN
ncbi:MAG: hypothetical protein JO302_06860 [Candidatus Eremiobacteraeota bacterium]|nr:hypothetical protein [Candidatus Eremiobacteraeota bacterium]